MRTTLLTDPGSKENRTGRPLWARIVAGLMVTGFAITAHANEPRCELTGYAELPARTFFGGGPSGRAVPPEDNLSGLPMPFPAQPVQGISSLVPAGGRSFFAIVDNGYALQERSADFELRIYRLGISLRRTAQEPYSVDVENVIVLRDGTGRPLTGADFDPESLVVMPDATFYFGEEYGPSLVHVLSGGTVDGPPKPLPVPRSALVRAGTGCISGPDTKSVFPERKCEETVHRSKGPEGMFYDSGRKRLVILIEGPFNSSQDRNLSLMLAYDVERRAFDERWSRWYPLDKPFDPVSRVDERTKIGELAALDGSRMLVVETDDGQGGIPSEQPRIKRLYAVDAGAVGDGEVLTKELYADLLSIEDPRGLAPHAHDRNGRFAMPFATIESLVAINDTTVLLVNDNNYPTGGGRGRSAAGADPTEFVEIRCPKGASR